MQRRAQGQGSAGPRAPSAVPASGSQLPEMCPGPQPQSCGGEVKRVHLAPSLSRTLGYMGPKSLPCDTEAWRGFWKDPAMKCCPGIVLPFGPLGHCCLTRLLFRVPLPSLGTHALPGGLQPLARLNWRTGPAEAKAGPAPEPFVSAQGHGRGSQNYPFPYRSLMPRPFAFYFSSLHAAYA